MSQAIRRTSMVLVFVLIATILAPSTFAKTKYCKTRAQAREYITQRFNDRAKTTTFKTKYKATTTNVAKDIKTVFCDMDQKNATRMRMGRTFFHIESNGHKVVLTKINYRYKTKKESINKHNYCKSTAETIIRQLKLNGKSEKEKAAAINNYLIDNTKPAMKDDLSHTAWSVFARKSGVCSAYADAFCYLAESAGLKATYISGAGSDDKGNIGNHAWNIVRIQNKWYYIDTIFGDRKKSKTQFFLKGTKNQYFLGNVKVKRGHKVDEYFTRKAFKKAHPISSGDLKL